MMQHRISISNEKGGVGKTTTAMNLAAALVQKGKKVLAIDFDPQHNLSKFLHFEPDNKPTLSNLMEWTVQGQAVDTAAAIRHHEEGIDYIPCDIALANADIYLVMAMCREQVLKRILAVPALAQYDYILIDCNPSLGLLLTNALVAATEVLIPVQAQMFGMEGMAALLAVIEQVRMSLNPQLYISGILTTMVDATNLSKAVCEALAADYGKDLFETCIPRLVEAAEAPVSGISSVSSPSSRVGIAYRQLAGEVIKRGDQHGC